MVKCSIHPNESATACFSCYLNTPCEEPGCDRTGDHNQGGRILCRAHLDDNLPAFARND